MIKKNKAIEIIPDKLFWISDILAPKNVVKSFYFNIDNDLVYHPFLKDFGPLNLGCTWRYITELQKLLVQRQYKGSQIYHQTSTDPAKAVNSAYLMGAFQIAVLGYTAERAFQPFRDVKFVSFRDASYGDCSYKCTLLDCLRGLEYAIKLGWFKYKNFNLLEYEHYEQVDNGDLNWIIPGKFVAFSSPYDKGVDKYGNTVFTPKDYIPIFKKLGVTMVIRLNNKTYQQQDFIKEGIKHHDLFFKDGTAPSLQIVEAFLKIVEAEPGAVAVHCKAGLGRTGSLIACYAMKHYRFNAADFIGWIRIARPGSILGPQQSFLISVEKIMKEKSKDSLVWKQISETMDEKDVNDKLRSLSLKKHEMNARQKHIMVNGEVDQGYQLYKAKNRSKRSPSINSNGTKKF